MSENAKQFNYLQEALEEGYIKLRKTRNSYRERYQVIKDFKVNLFLEDCFKEYPKGMLLST